MNQQLPNAGESLALGVLGGTGAVGFDFVALKTIHYTPASSTTTSSGVLRMIVVEGMTPTLIGLAIGVVSATAFGCVLTMLVFGVAASG